jgi:hypothetical protein
MINDHVLLNDSTILLIGRIQWLMFLFNLFHLQVYNDAVSIRRGSCRILRIFFSHVNIIYNFINYSNRILSSVFIGRNFAQPLIHRHISSTADELDCSETVRLDTLAVSASTSQPTRTFSWGLFKDLMVRFVLVVQNRIVPTLISRNIYNSSVIC